jgi:hypothetical protein
MNRILAVLAGGLLVGAFAAAYAELPPPTAQEKAAAAAKAEKAAAEKAKAAKALANAQDRAVANHRKQQGANHATARSPDAELTRQEAQTKMPKPGQANDHSTTARDPR